MLEMLQEGSEQLEVPDSHNSWGKDKPVDLSPRCHLTMSGMLLLRPPGLLLALSSSFKQN